MPDCTLRNQAGDTVTVERGGIGSDNIKGLVEQMNPAEPAQVKGAEVTVSNPDANTDDDGETDDDGQYDIDVNAEAGHTVVVSAEWTDSGGNVHVVRGTCKVS